MLENYLVSFLYQIMQRSFSLPLMSKLPGTDFPILTLQQLFTRVQRNHHPPKPISACQLQHYMPQGTTKFSFFFLPQFKSLAYQCNSQFIASIRYKATRFQPAASVLIGEKKLQMIENTIPLSIPVNYPQSHSFLNFFFQAYLLFFPVRVSRFWHRLPREVNSRLFIFVEGFR